ncbi:MAG TPA: hypothetical protein VIA80_18775 [Hyphomonadaceae bacterium]
MQCLKFIAASIALVSLGGCQSLAVMALKSFDEKPYSLPVTAQQLDVPAPVTEAIALEVAEATPVEAPAEAVAAAQPIALGEPALEPARTDIRGQGDGAMTDERVVVTARKEIQHRVPNYSREQVAAMVCTARNSGRAGRLKSARRAYDATVFAYETRVAFEAGQRTAKEADAAERKRQDAVGGITGGVLFSMFGGRMKKDDLPKAEFEGLVLENVDLYTFNESGRAVMAVSGIVRNTTSERADLPPLTLAAIDQWQFILAGQTSLLPVEALEPGESKAFELRFHNPPDTTYEVYVHFAPPFEYRMRRECDAADAGLDTPSTAPRTAQDAAAITSPVHTAPELNLLTRIYRNEAQSTWNLRNCAKPKEEAREKDQKSDRGLKMGADGGGERRGFSISIGLDRLKADGLCAAWARRLPWRESFALGEATDEAWGALLAAEEMRRQRAAERVSQADVDAAEAASARAYANFRELGARTLARAGTSVPDVAVEIASSNFGYEQMSKVFDGADISQVGFYVEVAGAVRNTGTAQRNVGALMLALVDRLEQPLLTFRLDESMQLAAGEAREFTHRVYLAEPIRLAESIRREEGQTPAWQVRIGAVAN